MKLLYKPFAIVASIIAARMGKGIFKSLWVRIDHADPPPPTAEDAGLGKVVGAAALEAATMAGVGALADRAAARVFQYLTGYWPAEKKQKSKE